MGYCKSFTFLVNFVVTKKQKKICDAFAFFVVVYLQNVANNTKTI